MRTSYGEAFARRGGRYERSMARSPEVRQEEFGAMLRHLRPVVGECVVDAPSGGAHLRALLPAHINYVAVEEAPQFHVACNLRLLAGDRALLAPCHSIPLPEASCDAVCSLAGLHHLHDRAPVYAEWHRLLRPGGRVVLADVADGTAVAGFLNGFVDRYNPEGHDGLFLGETDTVALMAAGFEDIASTDVAYHWHFRDLDHVAEFCVDLFGLDRPGASKAVCRTLQRELDLQRSAALRGWILPWGLRFLAARKR